MARKGFYVTSYIDDIIGHELVSKAKLVELGLNISQKQLVTPTTKAVCLGVEINTATFEISVPQKKLDQIRSFCKSWTLTTKCSRTSLQSLLGKLLCISKCVKASRPLLNRMLDILRAADMLNNVQLTAGFPQNLALFCKFLPRFNGTSFFKHTKIQGKIELDASLQGVGAIFNNQVYAVVLPSGYMDFGIGYAQYLGGLPPLGPLLGW